MTAGYQRQSSVHAGELLQCELATAAREISLYLQHRRAVDERRRVWRSATVAFFASLLVTATLANALSDRAEPRNPLPAAHSTKVGKCRARDGTPAPTRAVWRPDSVYWPLAPALRTQWRT
ncbi:MAG: hypothetical protein ACYC9P_05010 [Rudaea sp.]